MKKAPLIKTISFDQYEIIRGIMKLYCNDGFELDPTYSKGVFYEPFDIPYPNFKFDLFPRTGDIKKANANCLPLPDSSIRSIMFDPPFLAGDTTGDPAGKMHKRFSGFPYMKDLWSWYSEVFVEFKRVIKPKGVIVVKCQDTVSSGKQWLSHVFIINELEKLGFYSRDMFILLAKSRMIGHNHANQKHARKFHSYFLVFEAGKRK